MSAAAAPWSVKGIDPKAREVAKDLARRSGMTLGEWLNTMIMDDEDDGVSPLPRRAQAEPAFDRRGRSRRLDDAYEMGSRDDETLLRVAASVEAIAARLEAAERRSTIAIQGVDQAVAGLVRRMEAQDQQTGQYGRRIDDISDELKEGHKRLRRFEQDAGPKTAETIGKVEQALGGLAGRLYDIEERQRSGLNEVRQRLDGVEKADAWTKTETAVAALTSRLYDLEERNRAHSQTLISRIEAVEKAAPGAGADVLARVGQRLDAAQNQTSEALRNLERSFAGLDQRLRAAETRVEPEGAREAARFEKLAETLSRQVDANRTEMMRKLETAETEGRMARIEATIAGLTEQTRAAEQRSAQGIDAMGREVLRIAQNLDARVARVETAGDARLEKLEASLTQTISDKIDRDMGRYGQAIEHRLNRADDQHAIAIEKLGVEITRISDRLADRIAQSERKSAQALEDIGRRMIEGSDRIEQRYDRASGELAERMRLSEERTAKLLAEARETLDQRAAPVAAPVSAMPAPVFDPTPQPLPEPEPQPAPQAAPMAAEFAQPDWRSAAFPEDEFAATQNDDGWSIDSLSADLEPFPEVAAAPRASHAASLSPVDPETGIEPSLASTPRGLDRMASEPAPFGAAPQPFGGFGGADVSDALEAIAEIEPQPVQQPVFAAPVAESFASARTFDGGDDDFAAETEFVDSRRLRAGLGGGAAAGRAASTRDAISAARAAMNTPAAEEPAPRASFGLGGMKKGGKSRLQERLDKQASQGGTAKKAFLASVTGVAVVAGVISLGRVTGYDVTDLSQLVGGSAEAETATPIAALAIAPGDAPLDASPADATEAQTLFAQATEQLDRNDPAGVETLTRAANLGEPQAQLKLAALYQTGENGVTADAEESRLWARRAAEGGDARGMHAFGMYLFDGVGGARNRPEALDWLKKAADQGLVDSQYNVARIYENGDEGIAPNPTQAYRWYLIAARAGDPQAQAAVDRLAPTIPAAARQTARAQAEAFALEPLA
ncbi:SEL1-like repeat protein [Brevundimonas sp.]